MPGPGGCLLFGLPGLGQVCSGRVPGPGEGGSAPRGVCSWGSLLLWGSDPRGAGIPACTEADTPIRERRLLLWTVRILLECIFVTQPFDYKL